MDLYLVCSENQFKTLVRYKFASEFVENIVFYLLLELTPVY